MIKLCTLLKLKRQIRILEHANNDLESELALQKEYNGSNLRRIDRLEKENTELVRKLKKLFINPTFETIINRAVFLNEELIVYPQREKYNRDVYDNLSYLIKFLFGEGAYVVEDCTNGYPSFTIKGANFELRNARTINADWTYKEVKQ